MSQSLVAFDTDHIKAYVFATSKLREIRGASALLDRLNREEMIRLSGGDCIYANGGAGLFKVDSARAEAVIQDVARAYRQQTETASVTGAQVALTDDQDDVKAALELLRHRLRNAKHQSTVRAMPLTHSLLHFCGSCGVEYAYTSGQEDMLCLSCHQKQQQNETTKTAIENWQPASGEEDAVDLWGRLLQGLHQRGYPTVEHRRPESFEELGQRSVPEGYMALIYADGDNMGREIEKINTLAKMKRFADGVDNAIYQATQEAISAHLTPEQNDDVWPFDILLLGGDDLVMVARAQSGLESALHIVERFPALTEESWGTPLHLSAAVVFSHINFPIGSLLTLAETSLKFAKQQAARRRLQGEALPGGLLNFLVVSSANHLDFGQYFEQTLRQEEENEIFYRTQRPYTAPEMADLLDRIRRLGHVPRTKLEQLRAAVFKNKRQGTIDAMMATLRLRDQAQREALLELVGTTEAEQLHLPWMAQGDDWVSPVLDVVELLDFVGDANE